LQRPVRHCRQLPACGPQSRACPGPQVRPHVTGQHAGWQGQQRKAVATVVPRSCDTPLLCYVTVVPPHPQPRVQCPAAVRATAPAALALCQLLRALRPACSTIRVPCHVACIHVHACMSVARMEYRSSAKHAPSVALCVSCMFVPICNVAAAVLFPCCQAMASAMPE
jgi:hypothetical protein